jgi:hypothetical protein
MNWKRASSCAITADRRLPTFIFEDEPGRRSAAKLLSKGAADRRQHCEIAGA